MALFLMYFRNVSGPYSVNVFKYLTAFHEANRSHLMVHLTSKSPVQMMVVTLTSNQPLNSLKIRK